MQASRCQEPYPLLRIATVPLRRLICLATLLGLIACSPVPIADTDGSSGAAGSGRDAPADTREPPRRTYHVQVRTVEEKAAADATVEDVVAWFDGLARSERPAALSAVGTIPVAVRWKAPFYRVRVGPFSSRDAAQTVVEAMRSDFPDVFIAREAVTRRSSR